MKKKWIAILLALVSLVVCGTTSTQSVKASTPSINSSYWKRNRKVIVTRNVKIYKMRTATRQVIKSNSKTLRKGTIVFITRNKSKVWIFRGRIPSIGAASLKGYTWVAVQNNSKWIATYSKSNVKKYTKKSVTSSKTVAYDEDNQGDEEDNQATGPEPTLEDLKKLYPDRYKTQELSDDIINQINSNISLMQKWQIVKSLSGNDRTQAEQILMKNMGMIKNVAGGGTWSPLSSGQFEQQMDRVTSASQRSANLIMGN